VTAVPTFRQVFLSLYGAWRLARFDPTAMAWFDRSAGSVERSFWAAVLAYPGFLCLRALHVDIDPTQCTTLDIVQILLVETIGYVILWTLFPLIIVFFGRWLRREEQSLDFIMAYNWSQVLQTVVLLVAAGLVAGDFMPLTVAALFQLILFLALFAYEWFIARTALQASGLAATAIVLLDLVLTEGVSQVTQSLY
jgi:hypothetical protein